MIWANNVDFKNNWIKENEIGGGGQGEAWKVSSKKDGRFAFLKIIKSKKDKERRARFFREATIYDTMDSDKIPKLIESNAHQHNDMSFTPYIVTEFITGDTLDKWCEKNPHTDLSLAIGITNGIAEVVSQCHKSGIVHRDIKPQNIILKDENPLKPCLLDFGLNYHEMTELNFSTLDQQEVGNRFLRLPELAAGSLNKQDPRSDISFTAGILFYLITGNHPDLLMDDDGAMPHQRKKFASSFSAIPAQQRTKLLSFFDNCFSYRTENRYKDTEIFINRLNQILQSEDISMSEEDDYEKINQLLSEPSESFRTQKFTALEGAFNKVRDVLHSMASRMPHLILSPRSPEYDDNSCTAKCTWKKKGADDAFVMTIVKIALTGSEFVFSISGNEIYRTEFKNPVWDQEFENAISKNILPKIISALNNPYLHIPELEYFQEIQPFTQFSDAKHEAESRNKKIITFVYDNSKKNRGDLNRVLMYFLQNAKTRELMNENFTTALVPIEDFSNYSQCLEAESMETARWVLLDRSLNFIDQKVIYANSEEAEKIMENLTHKFKEPFFSED
ncbi:protein kinase domain-containing protein [Pantoea rwandensis]|nr:protein kinase [Pantoea rwandensis]